MLPDLSVVIGLYNKRPYIARAVESVFAQTAQNFEVVVVDDGSTDDGLAKLDPYRADSRLRIIRQSNAGNGAARNRGMRESRAPVVAFLDADDAFLQPHLEALAGLAARFPRAGLLATGFYTVAADGSRVPRTMGGEGPCLIEDYFAATCRHGYLTTTSGCAVRRAVIDDVGGFLEGVPIGEDVEYWARISLQYPMAYDTRPSTLYYIGVPGGAMSGFRWDPEIPPVVRMLSRWIGAQQQGMAKQSVVDYAAWILMNHAASGIAASERKRAREVLHHPLIPRSSFRFRRMQLCLATRMPEAATRGYLEMRERLVARA